MHMHVHTQTHTHTDKPTCTQSANGSRLLPGQDSQEKVWRRAIFALRTCVFACVSACWGVCNVYNSSVVITKTILKWEKIKK